MDLVEFAVRHPSCEGAFYEPLGHVAKQSNSDWEIVFHLQILFRSASVALTKFFITGFAAGSSAAFFTWTYINRRTVA